MKSPARVSVITTTLALLVALTGCGEAAVETNPSAAPAAQESSSTTATVATSTSSDAAEWRSHGRDYSEQRFSPLRQITADNIDQLGLAWFGDLAERGGSYETTPIVADGRIYVTTPWSKVYAFDARTGRQLWKYDPQVPGEFAVKLCCGIVNRGVGLHEGNVIWGTLDGRLVSVNGETGALVWEKQVTDPEGWHSITGAPRIANGRIFIGEAGSEYHQRGYMAAYDANNGDELWRWWAVPGDPALGFEQPELEMAATTWNGEWWKFGGGGTPWDAITFDPVTNLVYIGTGNGAPWPADVRSPGGGDNLFISSIVALDAETGEYRWHYQATPRDSWDYDNTQQLVTADLVIRGVQQHVVMQAPKNGVFYVLEAETGKPLSADLYVPSANWLTGFDENLRPIINPEANYGADGSTGAHVTPSFAGAHGWNPMAFNPEAGLMYIPTTYSSYPFVAEAGAKMGNQLLSINVNKRPEGPAPELQGAGTYLMAWDPVQRRSVWEQRIAGTRAGVLATGGNLVFQSTGSTFKAYRGDTGEEVWSSEIQSGAVGGPVSYEIDGEQYIAAVSGQGTGNYWAPNYARLLIYKLGGTAVLPEMLSYTPPVLNPPANFGDSELLARGEAQYTAHCASCHGTSVGRVSSIFPDLRYAAALNVDALFKAIVIDGALQNNGMVSFAEQLTVEDAEAIRAYVVSLANAEVQARAAPPPTPAAEVH